MSILGDLLRRARLRGLKEGKVQTVRAESLENQAHDDAERWQDYGFAANPGDGQGLVLHVGGHTIVLRMDRIGERPQLGAGEVSVWHKEGHRITLKAGGVVEFTGTRMVSNMSGGYQLNGGPLKHNGKNVGDTHTHGGVASGGANTATPN